MINPVTNIVPLKVGESSQSSTKPEGDSFASVLGQALDKVGQMETDAAKQSYQLAAGQSPDMHTALIASEQANLAIQLTVQVRNKAVEAYQEIMRMQM